jgi:hypothetical protein
MIDHQIRTLGIIKGERLDRLREINDLEYEEILKINEDLKIYNKLQELYRTVIGNFFEYQKFTKDIKQIPSSQLNWARRYFDEMYFEANRLLINYFTAFRTYTDHTERILKKHFAKDSIEVIDFKKETNFVYDKSFAYRLIYKLRNYTQHCGMPVGYVSYNAEKADKPESMIGDFNLMLDRDRLLADYDAWSTLKEEIAKQKELFDLHSLVCETVLTIRHLDGKVDGFFQQIITDSMNTLVKYYGSLDLENLEYCVYYNAEKTSEFFKLNIEYIATSGLRFKEEKKRFFKKIE